MALAVVILTYNSADEIVECLRSVRRDDPSCEIVIVDNASTDDSVARVRASFPDVRIVLNERNVGFAAAANQGVRETESEVVVLLNPDCDVRAGTLAAFEDAMRDHPRAGAVGALVRNTDGSVQPTKRAFPSLWQSFLHATIGTVWPDNPGTRAYVLADVSFDEPRQVGWIAATAVAYRRAAFDAVGGFDESFFFFVEDVDLCKRLRDAGWEIWFEPRAEVVHLWGGSWTRRPLKFMVIHHVNLFRYVRKHRRGAWVLAYPFIALGLATRFMLLAIRWLITRRSVPAHKDLKRRTSP
jgi:N-acetylglucosaminyl-diphospho-decaprenol L-rhamnosyltransferase